MNRCLRKLRSEKGTESLALNDALSAANTICCASEDIVARQIEGEIVIAPLTAGIGDVEDEPYTLNETGRAIWDRLDGKQSLKDVAAEFV